MSVRRSETDLLHQHLQEPGSWVHIDGERGIGKSTLLTTVAQELPDTVRVHRLNLHQQETNEHVLQRIHDALLDGLGRLGRFRLGALSYSGAVGIPGLQVGVSWSGQSNQAPISQLEEVARRLSDKQPIVVLVDDVHRAYEEPAHLVDAFRRIREVLPDNVTLVTAGRTNIGADAGEPPQRLTLGALSLAESRELFEDAGEEVDEETLKRLHHALEGHPFYLALLAESGLSGDAVEIPQPKIRRAVERLYLDTLGVEEERFLVQTSPLTELEEELVAAVLPDRDRVEVRRLLKKLRDKAVVRSMTVRATQGEVLVVHDILRQVLYELHEDPDSVHRRAVWFYSGSLAGIEGEDQRAWALESIVDGFLARAHLYEITGDGPSWEAVAEEVRGLDLPPLHEVFYVFCYGGLFLEDTPDEWVHLVSWSLGRLEARIDDAVEDEDNRDLVRLGTTLARGWLSLHGEDPDLERATGLFEEGRSQAARLAERKETDDLRRAWFVDLVTLTTELLLATEREDQGGSREGMYHVLAKYGLEEDVARTVVEDVRSFLARDDVVEQVEKQFDARISDIAENSLQGRVTRTTLSNVVEQMGGEVRDVTVDLPRQLPAVWEEALDIVHTCGEELERASNPLYAYLWYTLFHNLLDLFTEDALALVFEERAERFRALREEYEDRRDVIYSVEDEDPEARKLASESE